MWNNPGKGVVPSPTPQCSNYWKGSLLVTLDYSRQLYFTYWNVHLLKKNPQIPFDYRILIQFGQRKY